MNTQNSNAMKKVLFIDRDGTLIIEPPVDYQVDSLEKLEFFPGVFRNLFNIRKNLDYELVIVSNQDGLGTSSFPKEDFQLPHDKMIKAFNNEGIEFDDILIDPTMPEDNAPTRKPGTGMFGKYLSGDYDLANSFVIGDRITDVELAKNLGAQAIFLQPKDNEKELIKKGLGDYCKLITESWDDVFTFLSGGERTAEVQRETKETKVTVKLDLDGSGNSNVETGLGFFNHMLEQIGKHSGSDLTIHTKGDLEVDEHHTMEDTAIALGEAFYKALGSKRGIERYGFCLPMDDSMAIVSLDFGGRSWLVWEVGFTREKVGDVPTEMFYHFFKSFADSAKCNLYVKVEGDNDHHKAEAIFKAFARALKMAIQKDVFNYDLPSTKGVL